MRVGIQFFPDVGPEVKSARDYWQEALHLVALVPALALLVWFWQQRGATLEAAH